MVFLKLFILILSAFGAGFAAFELNNFSRYKNIYNSGVEKFEAGDYKGAERAFRKVSELDSEMVENFYNWGLSLFYLNKYETALSCFQKTIELNPQEHDAYYNMGIIYYLRNNKKEAISNLNKAVEISNKKDEPSLFCIALIYSELQDYDDAIQAVSKLIELQPSNIDYRMLLADIYEKLIAETGNIQSVDFAIRTYEEILEINERHEGANVKLANCYAKKGDIDKCKQACQRALGSNPKSAGALQFLGVISFATQEFDRAIQYFEQAYTANPNLKDAYLNSAYAYAKIDNNAKANELYGQYKARVQAHEISEDMEFYFSALQSESA